MGFAEVLDQTKPSTINIRNISLFIFLLSCTWLQAQEVDNPRFFELSIQNAPRPQQLVTSDLRSVTSSQREVPLRLESQLRYPISLKGKTQIIGEISYNRQSLSGFYSLSENENEDIDLQQMSVAFMSLHRYSPELVLKSRIGLKQSSSRLFELDRRSTLYSTTHLLEQETDGRKIGFGARIAYRDRLTVIPVFLYEKDFNAGWSMNVLLPAKITVEKLIDVDKRLIMGFKGSSSNYYVENDLDFVDQSSNFRRIAVNAMFAYEKQFTPILGANIEVGASIPFFSGLYGLERRWQLTHDFKETVTPYLKAGIFCAIGH